jgi:hypothetical protein
LGVLALKVLKSYLKITDESKDALLQAIATATSKSIETYCRRVFDQGSPVDEEYDGTDTTKLWLNRTPITLITSVKYGLTGSLTTLDPTYYRFHETAIYTDGVTGFIFNKTTHYWKISYTGGYTSGAMPQDLVWAACKIAALDYREQDNSRIGLLSKSIGGEVVESYVRELPKDVKAVLDHYRRILL